MKHLETIDEIQEYFARLANSEEFNSKMTLIRIYRAAKRYTEDDQRTNFILKAYENDKFVCILDRTYICEQLSIAKIQERWYDEKKTGFVMFVNQKKAPYVAKSFLHAVIVGICLLYGNPNAALYIMRMLEMEESGE